MAVLMKTQQTKPWIYMKSKERHQKKIDVLTPGLGFTLPMYCCVGTFSVLLISMMKYLKALWL